MSVCAADAALEPLLDRVTLSDAAKAKFDGANPLTEIAKAKGDLTLNPGNDRDWARLTWAQLAAGQFDAAEASATAAQVENQV